MVYSKKMSSKGRNGVSISSQKQQPLIYKQLFTGKYRSAVYFRHKDRIGEVIVA